MNRGRFILFWFIRAFGMAAVLSCVIGFTQIFSAVRLMVDENTRPPGQQSLAILGCLAILFFYQIVSIVLLIIQQKSLTNLRRTRAAILFQEFFLLFCY